MKTIKSRYNYDPSQALTKQYQDKQVFNGYYKCFDLQTNNHYLLSHFKTQNKTQLVSLNKKFTTIKQKLQGNTNKYITKIYDAYMDKNTDSLFLILQWSEGGSIIDYIGKIYTLDWKSAMKIIAGILNAIIQLHKLDIVNSFINLQNIQIDQNGTPKLSFKCVIYKTLYLSPQFRIKHQKVKQGDLYSLGVCLYRLIYGIFPYKSQNNQQFKSLVENGPQLIILKGQNQFPIICPNKIQQIIKDLLKFNPDLRSQSLEKIQQFNKYLNINTTLNLQIYNKLMIKSKYINLFTMVDELDQHQYVILDKKEKRILKTTLICSTNDNIQTYIKKTLDKFAKLSHQNFLKIYQYQIIDNQYLFIVYSYCSDGNLLQYRKMSTDQNFGQKIIQNSINSIKDALRNLQSPFNYLTNQNVFLKNGTLRIKFPEFSSKRYVQNMKKISSNKKQSYFIAPQILAGKQSKNADSWSIGVLQYWMIFNQMPCFDSNGTVLINKKQKLTKQKIMNLHKILQKDTKLRQDVINQNEQDLLQFLDKNQFLEQINKNKKDKKTNKSPIKQTRTNEQIKSEKKQPNLMQTQKQQKKLVLVPKQQKQLKKNKEPKQTAQDLGKQSPNRKKKKQPKMQKIQINNTGSRIDSIENIQPLIIAPIIPQVKKSSQGNKFKIKKFQDQIHSQSKIQIHQVKQKKTKKNSLQQLFENGLQKIQILGGLQKNYTKSGRIVLKCIIAILFYLFLFYFNFFRINCQLISDRNSYQVKPIQIRAFHYDPKPNIVYPLVTKTPLYTNKLFYNTSLNVLRDDYRCVLNHYSVQSNVVGVIQSSGFVAFQVFGILIAIVNIMLICLVLGKLDICKALSITNFQQRKYYSIYNWFMVNLAIMSLTSLHYLIYGGLYHLKLQPCLGKTSLPGVQFLFKNWISSWIYRFIWIYIGIIIAYTVIIYFIINPKKILHKYIYLGLIFLYFTGVGLRGIGKTVSGHQNIFGICGQLLSLIVGICLVLTDLIFSLVVKLRQHDKNQNNQIISIDQFNRTEQYLSNQIDFYEK